MFSDVIEFDEEVASYGNGSPLKIRKEVVDVCWRNACSHSRFAVLHVKKDFSEKERATSNNTGDYHYKKKAFSPNRLKAVQELLALPSPNNQGRY